MVTKKTSFSLGVTRSDSIINEWLRVAAEVEIYLCLCRKKKERGKGGGGERGGTPEKIYLSREAGHEEVQQAKDRGRPR